MAMSKIKYAAAVLSAVLLSGCVMYSDKDEVENPQLDVTDLMYFNYVEPVFRITELADFFDRYQAVRDDREQSESLGTECFGEYFMPGNLYYELNIQSRLWETGGTVYPATPPMTRTRRGSRSLWMQSSTAVPGMQQRLCLWKSYTGRIPEERR